MSISRPAQDNSDGLHIEVRPLSNFSNVVGKDLDEETGVACPPSLSETALYGPVGDWVRLMAPHTEASPAALMICALASLGALIGRSAHVLIESTRHSVNLFVMLIGPSNNGRKGTAVGRVKGMLKALDADFCNYKVKSGLSSGQGITHHVRDRADQEAGGKKADPGVADKRLLVIEAEFAGTLRQMRRDGNTLSAILRQAYDGETLSTLTKADPMTATDPHIAIIAQITREEFEKTLDAVEISNGFLNRFMPIWTERPQLLPFSSEPDAQSLATVIGRLSSGVASAARHWDPMGLTEAAAVWWADHYPALTTGPGGRLGAATQRAPVHVRRVALLFAALDGDDNVDVPHLEAALAVWNYADMTAAFVLGATPLSPNAARLNAFLLAAGPDGANRTAIRSEVFGSNAVKVAGINAALAELQEAGLARRQRGSDGGGRRGEVWLHSHNLRSALPNNYGIYGSKDLSSHKSHNSAPAIVAIAPPVPARSWAELGEQLGIVTEILM